MNNSTIEDNYISIDEAAEYLGIKTVTLRNWIKKKPDKIIYVASVKAFASFKRVFCQKLPANRTTQRLAGSFIFLKFALKL